jgi:Fe-S cluster assembly protein SufB
MELEKELVLNISKIKNEPQWMLDIRLKALELFNKTDNPEWAIPDLNELDFNEISYFLKENVKDKKNWENIPEEIRSIYDKMGIPEAEQKYLGGSVIQHRSESIYENIRKDYESKGVIFMSLDEALKKHPELVKKYFTKCVSIQDNKYSMLHYAFWSGGSFLYVPKEIKLSMPMQAYFYMNENKQGQFEHTLIIVEEGAEAHYIEGCSAPLYDKNSIHSAVVEVFVHKNSKVRYSTIQNWSKNIYNLNTKRAIVEENGLMEWVGGSLGSKVSMLYPASVLKGKGARANHLTITLAPEGTIKEGGAKVIHLAPDTHSNVISKGICIGNGIGVYRGLIKMSENAINSTSTVKCDSLMIGDKSQSITFPHSRVENVENVKFTHEATAGRISQKQLDYLMSKGLTEQNAIMLFITGFINPVLEEIPLEYVVELNRFIKIEMDNAQG